MITTVQCPDCQADSDENKPGKINVPIDAEVGEILECPECGAEMELLSTNPPLVSLIEEEK